MQGWGQANRPPCRGGLTSKPPACKAGYMTATVAEQIRSHLSVRRDLPSPAERRALREAADLSQEGLARIVGATRQAISHWEAGIRTPRGVMLDRYVQALNALREGV